MEEYKVIILGAGISGISCAIYLKRAGIKPLIIEKNIPGGQLNKIELIENYPGHPQITGFELTTNLLEQIKDIPFEYNDITNIDYKKKIITTPNKTYKYNYLVFATGRREKLLELPNEQQYLGAGLSLCATCDGNIYEEKEVAIIGGGNTALTEALYLSNICKKVTIIHRNNNLKADDILKKRITTKKNIEIILNNTVKEYITDKEKIIGIKLKDNQIIKTACIFLAIGNLPNSELFTGQKENNYIKVNNKYQTNLTNVYACGDVIKKKLYQLITASSEGAEVANNIIKKINGCDRNE